MKDRLTPGKIQGRYVVVGMHSNKEEYILVGQSGDREKALNATNFFEENSMFYIALCYDLLDPDDRAEFETKVLCPFIEPEDQVIAQEARRLCGS